MGIVRISSDEQACVFASFQFGRKILINGHYLLVSQEMHCFLMIFSMCVNVILGTILFEQK